jgi:hypothetical protein
MGQSLNGFQIHHIISQDVATYNPLIKALTATGYFNLNEDSNLIELPATQQLAEQLGSGLPAGSVSPHPGGPLGSYENGMAGYLGQLTVDNPAKWAQAQGGNPDALQFFRDQVTALQDSAARALYSGELFTNTPSTLYNRNDQFGERSIF